MLGGEGGSPSAPLVRPRGRAPCGDRRSGGPRRRCAGASPCYGLDVGPRPPGSGPSRAAAWRGCAGAVGLAHEFEGRWINRTLPCENGRARRRRCGGSGRRRQRELRDRGQRDFHEPMAESLKPRRNWKRSTVARRTGVAIILLSLSCAALSSRVFDHSALAEEGSPSAELTIIRPRALFASAGTACQNIDGETIVCLRVGRYSTFRLRPGHYRVSEHHRFAHEIDIDAETIDLKAGDSVYLLMKGEIHKPEIRFLTPAEARALMRKYKRIPEDWPRR